MAAQGSGCVSPVVVAAQGSGCVSPVVVAAQAGGPDLISSQLLAFHFPLIDLLTSNVFLGSEVALCNRCVSYTCHAFVHM